MGLFSTSLQDETIRPNERRYWWMSLFALCAILGALVGASFKTQNQIRKHDLPARNYSGLAQEYIDLKKQYKKVTDDDDRTIAGQRLTINHLESDTTQSKALVEDLNQAKSFAGLTPVQGPGVIVTLNDSKKPFPATGLPAGMVPPNLIHDTDINMTVNELKAAGAEAISVNDQRLVATSPIRCAGPTVYVNNVPQTPPYIIKAIGDPTTLLTALNLSGGVATQIRQFDPDMMKMQKAAHITIPAYVGATQPKYAKPAAEDSDRSGNSADRQAAR